jgi:hypothetical protein
MREFARAGRDAASNAAKRPRAAEERAAAA